MPIATIGCGFLAVANGGKLAGMSWHRTPTDDAWKQAHLAMVEGFGKRLWLGCGGDYILGHAQVQNVR